MKYLIVLIICIGFIGCTSKSNPVATVGCDVETAVATTFTSTIATTLNCTNTTQIQSDLMGALGKTNLCSMATSQAVTPNGPIGSIACPIVVNAAIGLAATKIPSSWECSPTATIATLSTALSAACTAVVPFKK